MVYASGVTLYFDGEPFKGNTCIIPYSLLLDEFHKKYYDNIISVEVTFKDETGHKDEVVTVPISEVYQTFAFGVFINKLTGFMDYLLVYGMTYDEARFMKSVKYMGVASQELCEKFDKVFNKELLSGDKPDFFEGYETQSEWVFEKSYNWSRIRDYGNPVISGIPQEEFDRIKGHMQVYMDVRLKTYPNIASHLFKTLKFSIVDNLIGWRAGSNEYEYAEIISSDARALLAKYALLGE